ncbi:HNH endonuclease signature motif containing protein, partial [Mycetocola miduiensis]
IDPETARKLAGRSKTWYRLLTDPESGALLSLGRTRYTPTKQMRDYLVLRDGTCRWEGCNRQATHCEIDHTEAWEFGGPTDCDNLSHVCPKHHRMKHQTTWTAKQLPGGVIRWTSPDGRSYVTEPDVALPMPATWRYDEPGGSGPPDPNPATAPPPLPAAPPPTEPNRPPPF